MMFEKASALNANTEAATKPMKLKPRKPKIIEEYDIGSNGDELLAKEIGKPGSKRNENANKATYKPTIKKSTPNVKKDNKSSSKPSCAVGGPGRGRRGPPRRLPAGRERGAPEPPPDRGHGAFLERVGVRPRHPGTRHLDRWRPGTWRAGRRGAAPAAGRGSEPRRNHRRAD